MRNQLHYENLFSAGFAAGQPPTQAQLDVALQAINAELVLTARSFRHMQAVRLFSDATLVLALLFFLSGGVYLLLQDVSPQQLSTIIAYSVPLMVGVILVQFLARFLVMRKVDRALLADLPRIESAADALRPLAPDDHPEACVAYADLGDEHEMIRAYQRQIAAQGRLPVMAEYTFAEAWVKNKREQQARDAEIRAAKAACQRWAKPA